MQTIKKLILCADDDPDDRELLCETATKLDPSVTIVHAEHGEHLLKKLEDLTSKNLLPCLIILDMNMPVMDGKTTLIELRKHSEWNKIPVAIFTTSPRHLYSDLEFNYNVTVVTKPTKYSGIMNEVTQLLSHCKAA